MRKVTSTVHPANDYIRFLRRSFRCGTIVDLVALYFSSIFIQFTFSVLYPLLRKDLSLSVSEGLSRGESSITPEPFSISTRYYYNIAFPKLPTNCFCLKLNLTMS
ncbi:hypothetical protein ALC53_13788 [Atta colombica]|uniref:Uncharacterized protein n=1 Tax=Atta colombica TaxID=520822 RepID=A0A195AUM9_9HYME|nr:hypothetical protein ALC53_13788 [Atta colombica]